MMMLAALSMFVVSTAFMALPILVGRGFLESVSFIMLRIGLKRDGVLYFPLHLVSYLHASNLICLSL